MVSLWGSSSKNDEEEREPLNGENGEDGEEDTGAARASPRRAERRHREPDERSRLLPRNEGYLDPDDPAVSTSIRLSSVSPAQSQRRPY